MRDVILAQFETDTAKSEGRGTSTLEWILAAKSILISDGIQGLGLRRLAQKMGMTTGAFYGHFKNFDHLLDALRNDWLVRNSAGFDENFDKARGHQDRYFGYLRILLDDTLYEPAYDGAVRDWAHSSTQTAQLLAKVDARRIGQLEQMYRDFGYETHSAHVRAQLAYFHQIGYYSVGIDEPIDDRLRNIPYYAEIICPQSMPVDIPLEELRLRIFG